MGRGWAALALLCALAMPGRAYANPWLTIQWVPIVAPAQLVVHELTHAAMVEALGGRVTEISFLSHGRFGTTGYAGIGPGMPTFAVSVAPRLLDIGEMLLFSALRDGTTNPHLRGLYDAVRISAWADFEFNTCKIGYPEGPSDIAYGNDAWDTMHGLGLGSTEARVSSAVLAIGVGWLGFHWMFQ
ncbi:MAG: hypothetical protein ACJ783_11140 [Myxococcales bacterium]